MPHITPLMRLRHKVATYLFTRKKKRSVDLANDAIGKLFLYYFIPSAASMLAVSTFSTIDGIFVGQRLGPLAVAAVGLAWPAYVFFMGYMLLFSIGGSTLVSYFLSKGDKAKANLIFSSIIYFVIFSSIIIGFCGYYSTSFIANLLGAKAGTPLHIMVVDYVRMLFIGAPFLILAPVANTMIVNDRHPNLAMAATIIASVANIVLNYIFLFLMGMDIGGSALGTWLANAIGLGVTTLYLLSPARQLRFCARFSVIGLLNSCKTGLTSAASEFSAGFMILYINATVIGLEGSYGASVYGVVIYVSFIFFILALSVANSIQPLVSYTFGINGYERLIKVLFFGIFAALAIDASLYALIYLIGYEPIIRLFLTGKDVTPSLLEDTKTALSITLFGYIMLGLNITLSMFLQSIQRTYSALIITLFQTIGFLLLLMPTFAKKWGLVGVWTTLPTCQVLTLCLAMIIYFYEFRYGAMAKVRREFQLNLSTK